MRPFVLHTHCYQPERLNPWTGELDPEPSAAPDRDWNERILRECYHPNAFARIRDEQGRIVRIVNNYEQLSFNFGPTLLGWMERAHPRTYNRILDGDWRSLIRTGHGNALAQAYNHMILPLANERDRRTQIAWGLADFRHRFRREAEGMWLPETACDSATADALIDAGVRFTILAPRQAQRVRDSSGTWQPAGAHLDTGKPYRLYHSDGSGRWLAVFFYDGALAQSLAFDTATADTSVLLDRFEAAARPGLISAALDGETFGHHHPFAEMGLAYALFAAAERRGLSATNYAAYLAAHPPTDEVELVAGEGTSWSCAHGVGRWYRDCGCSTDSQPGWNQRWRTPLRDALDVVRDAAIAAFSERGADLLRDPWKARDAYIDVRLGAVTPSSFLERHAKRHLGEEARYDLWTLLEAQRHAMVMYTSCGWFFADIAGIETVYVLRSAARVLGLLDSAGIAVPTDEVLDILDEAHSNKPGAGTARDLWRGQVADAEVRPSRVAAQISLSGLVRPVQPVQRLLGHVVEVHQSRDERRGRLALGTAHVTVTSRATGRPADFAVAAMHLGDLDFSGVVAPYPGDDKFSALTEQLWDAFSAAPAARLLRLVTEFHGGQEFALDDLLPEARRELVGTVFADLTDQFRETYSRLYADHRRILEMLADAGFVLPRELRTAAELALSAHLEEALARAHRLTDGNSDTDPAAAFSEVRATLALARKQGYELDLEPVTAALAGYVEAATAVAVADPSSAAVDAVIGWLALVRDLGVGVDLSVPQELVYDVVGKPRVGRLGSDSAARIRELSLVLGFAPALT